MSGVKYGFFPGLDDLFHRPEQNGQLHYAAVDGQSFDFLNVGVDRELGVSNRDLGLELQHAVRTDGQRAFVNAENQPSASHFLQLAGLGTCDASIIPRINEWDFVRYGTISYGEQVISSDPPAGFLDARLHADLDRFTVTFDSPNYVYVDEIAIETTGAETPMVLQTRRLDNGTPETVEIVLNRSIPLRETTRFILNDGVAVNVIEYTFAPGDTNGDGVADLFDVAVFQNCFGNEALSGVCQACDLDGNGWVNLTDFAAF